MKEKRGFFQDIIFRYAILIIIGLFGLNLFYIIFRPITIIPVFFLFDMIFDPILIGNRIIIGQIPIILIDACIAGSAYFLLLILNLSTPEIKLSKRIKILLISFILFLLLNILRIFFLGLLYIFNFQWFDFTHKLFWYVLSTLMVVFIWFFEVKKFKIKDTPFYSDLKLVYKKSIFK